MFSFFRRTSAPSVVLPARTPSVAVVAMPLVREPADRSAHLDDQHLVFWNAEASRVSAAHLSEAAAAWLQAVSKHPTVTRPELPRLARA
jgi:hypothetical protein